LTFRLFKLFLSCLVLAGIYFTRLASRAVGRVPRALCVILYYHSVPVEERRAFASQMDMIRRLSTPVDLNCLDALEPGKQYTAITFDDAFADVIDNAIPELISRGIPARIFVTVAALARSAAWWPAGAPERRRPIATVGQIQNLPRGLISVGSHTMTHPQLSKLDEARIRYELVESKRQLESIVEHSVDTLSFPYGDFSAEVIRCSHESGYQTAFTTVHSFACSPRESYLLGRIKTDPSDWPAEYVVKILGGYVWHSYAVALKRWLRQWLFPASASPLQSRSEHPHS
jgi:peptidoglycan/xylan/chitin deacetylase (PgdA/CDA1 family)